MPIGEGYYGGYGPGLDYLFDENNRFNIPVELDTSGRVNRPDVGTEPYVPSDQHGPGVIDIGVEDPLAPSQLELQNRLASMGIIGAQQDAYWRWWDQQHFGQPGSEDSGGYVPSIEEIRASIIEGIRSGVLNPADYNPDDLGIPIDTWNDLLDEVHSDLDPSADENLLLQDDPMEGNADPMAEPDYGLGGPETPSEPETVGGIPQGTPNGSSLPWPTQGEHGNVMTGSGNYPVPTNPSNPSGDADPGSADNTQEQIQDQLPGGEDPTEDDDDDLGLNDLIITPGPGTVTGPGNDGLGRTDGDSDSDEPDYDLDIVPGGNTSDNPDGSGDNEMGILSEAWDSIKEEWKDLPEDIGNAIGKIFSPGGVAGMTTAFLSYNNQKDAAKEMRAAIERGQDLAQERYNQSRSDLAPYLVNPSAASAAAGFNAPGTLPTVDPSSAGTLLDTSKLTDPSSAIYQNADLPDLNMLSEGELTDGLPNIMDYNDPAYEWLRKEGMRDLENRAAAYAPGYEQGLRSGNTMAALQERGHYLAGNQMDKVMGMRDQLFGERKTEEEMLFDQSLTNRERIFEEGLEESRTRFGQLSEREKAETGQQLLRFEQENTKRAQEYANTLKLRQTLFGEALSADELDFLQKYNMASMGANAAAGQSSNAMNFAGMQLDTALAQGQTGVASAMGSNSIANDFIKSLFSTA